MIGSRRETLQGLAAGLSAVEDREMLALLNQNVSFGATPSFETTSAGSILPSNNPVMLESLHNFEDDMLGFDAAAREDGIDEVFLDSDPFSLEIREAAGVAWPTPWSEPSDWGFSTTNGWDASMAGVSSSSDHALFQDSLQGLDVAPSIAGKNERRAQFKAAITAAFQPGTKFNRDVVKKLLDKSLQLAKLAEERALVVKKARDAFQTNLGQVERNDREVARLYNLTFDAAGKMRGTATDANMKKLLALRAKNIELGRKTVRLQKVNLLASALAANTLTQLTTVQNIAQAVAAGAPQAIPALGLAYDKLGRENAKIRSMREQQREAWGETSKIKAARDMAGLEGFDRLNGLDLLEAPFDRMESDLAAFGKFGDRFKKAAKKVGRAVKKAAKPVANVARTATSATKNLVKSAVVGPVKGTIEAAKRISKGDVKGAFKAVGKIVVDQAKAAKDFAAKTVLKIGCDVANTKAFKVGVQAVGQAVGTVVGGVYAQPTVGGAVGNEAGGQVANLQRNTCGALKTVGLTDGKFKPGRIDDAAKGFAKRAWKETFSPQAQLRSLKNIAQNALGGQYTSSFNVGGVDVMKKIGLDPNKLVTNNPAIQNLYKQGTTKLQGKLQSQFQKTVGGALRKTGVPGADRFVSVIQSGNMSMPSIKSITEQGEKALKNQAAAIARRNVTKAVTRVVPTMVQKRITGVPATRAQLVKIASQLTPATVERTALPARAISRFLSQPTNAAEPYVGSIGRDF